MRGPKNASAPSTGSADQWRKSVPARSRLRASDGRGVDARLCSSISTRRLAISRDASAFAPRSTCCFDRDYTASTLSPPQSNFAVRCDRRAAAVVAAAIDASVATEYAPMRHALSPPRPHRCAALLSAIDAAAAAARSRRAVSSCRGRRAAAIDARGRGEGRVIPPASPAVRRVPRGRRALRLRRKNQVTSSCGRVQGRHRLCERERCGGSNKKLSARLVT